MHDLRDPSRNRGPRLSRVDGPYRHTQEFLTGVTEPLANDPIDFEEGAARLGDSDAIAQAVEDSPELVLLKAHCLPAFRCGRVAWSGRNCLLAPAFAARDER